MEMYTTILSPDEQVLLLCLLNDFMLGAEKVDVSQDFDIHVKNDHCSLWLSPKDVETLSLLLSKYDTFGDHQQKVLNWILED